MLNLDKGWKLRLMFPELSDFQFQVLMYYSFGSEHEIIADILNCSVSSVKQSLQRIRKKLRLERLEAVRAIYNARAQTASIVPTHFLEEYYETMYKKQ